MANQYFVRANGGPEAGPMSAGAVRDMVRAGELGANDLIRKDTSAQWMKIASVPQLASELPKPPPPTPDELGLHEARPTSGVANAGDREPSEDSDPPPKLKKVDLTMLLVLSFITLGIYGYIWFFGVLKSYRGITRRKEPNIELLFWVYLGCAVLGTLLAYFIIGFVFFIGSAVVGGILLDNVLKDRAKIVSQVGGVKGLADRGLLLALWIAGHVLFICGFPLALYQAYRFATDHNRIVKACAAARPDWVDSETESG